jgi:hypothetical protein
LIDTPLLLPKVSPVTRVYDLVMTHKLDADDFFIHCIQRLCAEAKLNFFLVEPLWVESFFELLKQGKVWPRVLLNMHSEHHQPEEIYHRLVKLAAERDSMVIDPPDRALAAFDKSRLHPRLVAAGIPVPFSVIAPAPSVNGWQLTEAERARLGAPFVVKPGMGYGRRGLVMDATSDRDLARSAAAWPDERYLLQRRIVPRQHNGVPLYWRVYFVFGTVWLSWWNCYNDNYRLVTPEERETFGLPPLEEIVRRIAALTGMTFFSSEIAQTDTGEFVVIDYVNDQCHLLSQSAHPQIGVPDELVAAIARRIVEAAQEAIRNRASRLTPHASRSA